MTSCNDKDGKNSLTVTLGLVLSLLLVLMASNGLVGQNGLNGWLPESRSCTGSDCASDQCECDGASMLALICAQRTEASPKSHLFTHPAIVLYSSPSLSEVFHPPALSVGPV